MMKRREFITLIGGAAAACPDVVYGQQPVAVIGLLGSSASDDYRPMIAAFQKGLSEAGYVEGRNVSFDHAWADNHYDRLPALASELARRGVNVILAASTPSALAAKAATSKHRVTWVNYVPTMMPSALCARPCPSARLGFRRLRTVHRKSARR